MLSMPQFFFLVLCIIVFVLMMRVSILNAKMVEIEDTLVDCVTKDNISQTLLYFLKQHGEDEDA